jgi:hypothetical protein
MRRRMRNRVSAISPPINSANTTVLAPSGSVPRQWTAIEQMIRAQAAGPAPEMRSAPSASAGATWWMVECRWDGVSVDQVRGVIRDGPAPSQNR